MTGERSENWQAAFDLIRTRGHERRDEPFKLASGQLSHDYIDGKYAIDTHQSLRILYSYLRMRSADWVYDGMQIGAGTLSGVLPTNEQPFNYGVHILGFSWVVNF